VDFADSITSGFVQASREYLSLHPDESITDANPMAYVRMCCFHFMKNLVAFLRSGVESDEHQTLILSYAKLMLEMATTFGNTSLQFKKAEGQFLREMQKIAGFDGWHAWWKLNNDGIHWRCLTEVGPGTTRHLLHSTTNASESQNRVIKEDHSMVRLPGLALTNLLEMQAQKEKQYKLALSGNRPSSSRPPPRKRDPRIAKTSKNSQLTGLPRGRRLTEGQGPPKTVSAYKKIVEKANQSEDFSKKNQSRDMKISMLLKNLSSKSFILWKWHRNSCAYDVALAVTFFAIRTIPTVFLHQLLETVQNKSGMGTRSVTKSSEQTRNHILRHCERLGDLWASPADIVEELGSVRDEFRFLMANCMEMSERAGKNDFASANRIMEIVSKALVLPFPSDLPDLSFNDVTFLICKATLKNIPPENWSFQHLIEQQQPSKKSLLFYFEFTREPDSRSSFEPFDFPLQMQSKVGQFKFLACIDCSLNHFRAHILWDSDRNFNAAGKSILPGLYLVDPLSHQRAEMICPPPRSNQELTLNLPKFRGTHYSPHLLIYYRSSTI